MSWFTQNACVIKQPSDYLVWAYAVVDLIAFCLMLTGFCRLFAQAWKMPNRWAAVWKVINVQPRGKNEWPNWTPEADLILRGALILLLLLVIAIVCFIVALRGAAR